MQIADFKNKSVSQVLKFTEYIYIISAYQNLFIIQTNWVGL